MGKLRERYWQEAVSDYLQRLSPYMRVQIEEVPEARIGDTLALQTRAMKIEGSAIQSKVKGCPMVVILDRNGTAMDSLELARWIKRHMVEGTAEISWVIGGPLGLDPEVIKAGHISISFSRLTFPHQMMRLILLEQLYRSMRIIKNEPYHL